MQARSLPQPPCLFSSGVLRGCSQPHTRPCTTVSDVCPAWQVPDSTMWKTGWTVFQDHPQFVSGFCHSSRVPSPKPHTPEHAGLLAFGTFNYPRDFKSILNPAPSLSRYPPTPSPWNAGAVPATRVTPCGHSPSHAELWDLPGRVRPSASQPLWCQEGAR